MDLLKEISLELSNYQNLISDYSGESPAIHYLNNLRNGIEERDIEIINHSLKGVDNWYTLNMLGIKTNQYVSTVDKLEHDRIQKQIKGFLNRLESYEITEMKEGDSIITNEKNDTEYKIFVSHSSRDSDICTPFVELLEDIGIPEDSILYTSLPRFGIPGDVDIYEYLRSKINENFYMFYMLSDNYYNSPVCLNEMGAAWVAQNEYSTFILPNLSVGIKGVVSSSRKAWNITNAIELNNLKEKLIRDFKITISQNKWEDKKNRYLEKVRNI